MVMAARHGGIGFDLGVRSAETVVARVRLNRLDCAVYERMAAAI
jgi:hypothetical protein